VEHWKRFPPERGGLLVPVDAGRTAAVTALNAYAACRPAAAVARAAAAATARLLGPARLAGPLEGWTPPLPADEWEALLQTLRRDAARFDTLAVLERRQPHRAGFALLLLQRGRAAAFVKLRPSPARGLAREAEALERLERVGPHPFHTPRVLDHGQAGGWEWLALSALPGPHRVPRAPRLNAVCAHVWGALADLPRDPAIPSRWTPMHGDLTPWNLREAPGHGLLLYDWERAGWGPPGADPVLYRVALAALRGGWTVREARLLCARWPEASAFWANRLRARRPADEGERAVLRTQLAILDPHGAAAGADETDVPAATCVPPPPLDAGDAEEPVVPIAAGGG
jgi:hypothetical protein